MFSQTGVFSSVEIDVISRASCWIRDNATPLSLRHLGIPFISYNSSVLS